MSGFALALVICLALVAVVLATTWVKRRDPHGYVDAILGVLSALCAAIRNDD